MNMLFKKSFKVSRISQKGADKITHLSQIHFLNFVFKPLYYVSNIIGYAFS